MEFTSLRLDEEVSGTNLTCVTRGLFSFLLLLEKMVIIQVDEDILIEHFL